MRPECLRAALQLLVAEAWVAGAAALEAVVPSRLADRGALLALLLDAGFVAVCGGSPAAIDGPSVGHADMRVRLERSQSCADPATSVEPEVEQEIE